VGDTHVPAAVDVTWEAEAHNGKINSLDADGRKPLLLPLLLPLVSRVTLVNREREHGCPDETDSSRYIER
jgi:hypothetical protein